MLSQFRLAGAGFMVMLASLSNSPIATAQEFDFAARQKTIKERFEKTNGRIRNEAVHRPPMINPHESDLADDEPVIGVIVENEARAYPLTMLFGGGGIFELLNDTCGGQPIAVSW
jgi:hypothetical protein